MNVICLVLHVKLDLSNKPGASGSITWWVRFKSILHTLSHFTKTQQLLRVSNNKINTIHQFCVLRGFSALGQYRTAKGRIMHLPLDCTLSHPQLYCRCTQIDTHTDTHMHTHTQMYFIGVHNCDHNMATGTGDSWKVCGWGRGGVSKN